jgi:hypothetical protein
MSIYGESVYTSTEIIEKTEKDVDWLNKLHGYMASIQSDSVDYSVILKDIPYYGLGKGITAIRGDKRFTESSGQVRLASEIVKAKDIVIIETTKNDSKYCSESLDDVYKYVLSRPSDSVNHNAIAKDVPYYGQGKSIKLIRSDVRFTESSGQVRLVNKVASVVTKATENIAPHNARYDSEWLNRVYTYMLSLPSDSVNHNAIAKDVPYYGQGKSIKLIRSDVRFTESSGKVRLVNKVAPVVTKATETISKSLDASINGSLSYENKNLFESSNITNLLYIDKVISIPHLLPEISSLNITLAKSNDDIDCWLHVNIYHPMNNISIRTVGFDIEWRPNFDSKYGQNKTALIQLSTAKSCLLIPTYYFKEIKSKDKKLIVTYNFSRNFRNFISEPDIIKVGCGIINDISKVESDFGWKKSNVNGIIDVNDIVSNLMELYATNKILNTLRKGGGLKYLGIFLFILLP